jgi:hypothetical protein
METKRDMIPIFLLFTVLLIGAIVCYVVARSVKPAAARVRTLQPHDQTVAIVVANTGASSSSASAVECGSSSSSSCGGV